MGENDADTVFAKVLGVTELLEEILLYLSLGDVIYNAQRVSKFWRDCIGITNRKGGSSRLRQTFFIEAKRMSKEEEMRDPLFLTFDTPEPITLNMDRRADLSMYHKFCEKTENAPFTFSEIRKLFSNNPTDTLALHNYVWQTGMLWGSAKDDTRHARSIEKFVGYCPNKQWTMCQYQLDNKKRHPILDCFDHVSCFWTGYKSHLIFVIGDRCMDSYEQTKQILKAINFLLNTEPDRATWKCGMVTQPICTKVTVFARTPTPARSEHQSFVNIDGVTIEELFQLIARVCKIAIFIISDEELLAAGYSASQAAEQRQAIGAVAEFEELLANMSLNTSFRQR
jgi:hypothetical protein